MKKIIKAIKKWHWEHVRWEHNHPEASTSLIMLLGSIDVFIWIMPNWLKVPGMITTMSLMAALLIGFLGFIGLIGSED